MLFQRSKRSSCECHSFENHTGRMRPTDIKIVGQHILGVTLTWGAEPAPFFRTAIECRLCGRFFTRNSYFSQKVWKRNIATDTNGWPLDAEGEPLPLYRERQFA